MRRDNATSTLTIFLKNLKIPIAASSIADELGKHPDYRSFAAMNDVLNYWNIPIGGFQIEFNQLEEVPFPCLLQVAHNGGEFAIISKKDKEHIYLSNEHWNNHKMHADDLISCFAFPVLLWAFLKSTYPAEEEIADFEF